MDDLIPSLPWAALLVLGAVHGVNPAMGWLFAVALGIQERDRKAVWRALAPLALGHALAIGAAVAAAVLLGRLVPLEALKWVVAATLVSLGVAHLVRHRHPARGGMRMGTRDLTLWSFLVATAHGAGLMAVPFVLGPDPAAAAGRAAHAPAALAGLPGGWAVALAVTVVHTAVYLSAAGLAAALVYEKFGVRLLRRAWINLDLLWAAALVVTGAATPLL
jgi:hypothetical protein